MELFNRLYEAYHDYVFVTCYAVLHHRQDAEDASQQTWINIWRSIASYREVNTKGWIATIATRASDEL